MDADDCEGSDRPESDGPAAGDGGDVHQPHDKLFKVTFSDIEAAAGYFKWRMEPSLAGAVDWDSLKLESGSFIDSHLRHSETDLLFSATMAGEPLLLYFLAEHLSTPDELMALKLLRYITRIHERQAAASPAAGKSGSRRLRLVPVFSFAVAQFAEDAGDPPQLLELFDLPPAGPLREFIERRIPDFEFDVLHLARTGYDEIEGSPRGILALRLLKAERARNLLADPVWDEVLILRVPKEFFEAMLAYVLVRDVDKRDFMTKVEALQPQLRTTAMTLAEKLTQEGRQEGLQKGRQEGRQEDILEALELRFGDVPEGLVEAVRSVAKDDHLRDLLRAAIQCGSLEEFSKRL